MKKLDMFQVITYRCRGTSLVSCEDDLLKEVPLFLICCIRADQDMQEHQQKPRQAATKPHFAGMAAVIFCVLPHS